MSSLFYKNIYPQLLRNNFVRTKVYMKPNKDGRTIQVNLSRTWATPKVTKALCQLEFTLPQMPVDALCSVAACHLLPGSHYGKALRAEALRRMTETKAETADTQEKLRIASCLSQSVPGCRASLQVLKKNSINPLTAVCSQKVQNVRTKFSRLLRWVLK